MKRGIMTLALGFILTMCAFSFNTPVALAENETDPNVPVEVTDTGETEEVTKVTEQPSTMEPTETDPSVNPEDPEATEDPEGELPPVTDENGDEVKPGTLPDSPFYWLTKVIEKLQVIFTVDPIEKTDLLEKQALKRMAEAKALIEEGNTEVAEVALKAYSAKVAEAQAFVATLTEDDSETREKLETALSNSNAKNIQTLGGLLDKLPPQAAEKVALNIVRSMEKSIAKMEKMEQKKVAKELRKATKGLEDSELAEEDREALEDLEEIIEVDDENLEDGVVADSEAQLSTMALMSEPFKVSNLKDNSTEVSKESRQSLIHEGKEKKKDSEAKVKKEEIKLQEKQQSELKKQEEKKEKQIEQEKKQEKKQEKEDKQPKEQKELNPKQDKVEKSSSMDTPTEKQQGEKQQGKNQQDEKQQGKNQQGEKQKAEKQDKSGNGNSKDKNKSE